MAVQVITDSVADLPADVVARHRLRVVPLSVSFGEETGGENMDPDAFYARLVTSDPLPTTSAPSPELYAAIYREILDAGDDAVVVTISRKLSATFGAAERAIELAGAEHRVAVVDSGRATIAEGFVAMSAARAAASGASLSEAAAAARETVPRVGFLAAFDTLEYLRRGGRIGAAKALLGSVLSIHPLVTLHDGVVSPHGRTRSRSLALDALVKFASGFRRVEALAIEHSDCAADALLVKSRLREAYPDVDILESRATPVIGTHTGPGLVVVSVLGDPT